MKRIITYLHMIWCVMSSMIGYTVNQKLGSSMPWFWATLDFFFWPFAWLKWLFLKQINLSTIKETFSFLFN